MSARATPATRAAAQAGITFTLHEYEHDASADSYALEAATALSLAPERVFKTLVVALGDDLTICMVPATTTLDLRSLGKHAALAPAQRAERVTGYVAGGISPLGQRRALPTLIDDSALAFETVFVSAGRRGLEMELTPSDLVTMTKADVRALSRRDGPAAAQRELQAAPGIVLMGARQAIWTSGAWLARTVKP